MSEIYRHLRVIAGTRAAAAIRDKGLAPDQVSAVFGASGAAKWLGICGLDQTIFGNWLSSAQQEILLFGTSVGAFKLAAACRRNAHESLQALADAYIEQTYPDGPGADAIDRETTKILDVVFGNGGAAEILSHPTLRYSCGTALTRGMMASNSKALQYLGAGRAMLVNVLGRNAHRGAMERVVFADPRAEFPVRAKDAYGETRVALNEDNLRSAVRASGSIPIMMNAVRNIPGGPEGVYVDGGVVDYHPVPGWFWDSEDLILYPHFYPHLKAGWFDKYYPRVARAHLLENVLLLAPSDEHLRSLDLGRIPDRRDFASMAGQDDQRMALWRDATDKSAVLGEAFLDMVTSGDIAARLESFP